MLNARVFSYFRKKHCICNIIKYAKNVTGTDHVYSVIGGIYLKKQDEITKKTIAFFKREKIDKVLPGHCTAFPALVQFYKSFGGQQLRSGDVIEF